MSAGDVEIARLNLISAKSRLAQAIADEARAEETLARVLSAVEHGEPVTTVRRLFNKSSAPVLIKTRQACSIMGVSSVTLWRMRRDGTGPNWCRMGSTRIMYDAESVREFVQRRLNEHQAAEGGEAETRA